MIDLDGMRDVMSQAAGAGNPGGGGNSTSAAPAKLNEIQELILQADLSVTPGDYEGQAEARRRVSIQLGCEPEDLEEVILGYGEDEWQTLVMGERVRRAVNTPQHKVNTWDRLEGAVLQKLVGLVEGNRVSAVSELLAIAKVANQAHRSYGRRGDGGSSNGGLNVTQNNYIAGQNGALPSGDLGTIKLTLSHRSLKQIEGEAIRSPGDPKTLDSMQMLTIEDVQKAGDALEVEDVG